jgi:hypothetical protein
VLSADRGCILPSATWPAPPIFMAHGSLDR